VIRERALYGAIMLATLAWILSGHEGDLVHYAQGSLVMFASLGLGGLIRWRNP
jgi:hypothetical protein